MYATSEDMGNLVFDVLLLQGSRHQLWQSIRRDFSHFFLACVHVLVPDIERRIAILRTDEHNNIRRQGFRNNSRTAVFADVHLQLAERKACERRDQHQQIDADS